MSGSKMTPQRKAVLSAVKKTPPGGDYVWDGKDEDDRPLTREEMQKGVEAYRKKRHATRKGGCAFSTLSQQTDMHNSD